MTDCYVVAGYIDPAHFLGGRLKLDPRAARRVLERVAEQRLRGGSRFNLRYKDRVPAGIRPEDVIAALNEYVDFRQDDSRRDVPPPSRPADLSLVRKGMLRDEAERAFGRPVDRSEKRDGGVVTITLVFDVGDQRLKADFVEDVLVRYTISSK